jgi:hypothetical protein
VNPAECWQALLAACEKDDWETAADRADDLADWKMRGGLRPDCIPEDVCVPWVLRGFARVCRAVFRPAGEEEEIDPPDLGDPVG